MGIPIYSDVDIKGGAQIGGHLEVNNLTSIKTVEIAEDAKVLGNARIEGNLNVLNKIQITNETITIAKPTKILDSEFQPDSLYTMSIEKLNVSPDSGEHKDPQLAIYERIEVPPQLYNAKWTMTNYSVYNTHNVEVQVDIFTKALFRQDSDGTNLIFSVTFFDSDGSGDLNFHDEYNIYITIQATYPAHAYIPTLYANAVYASDDITKGTVDARLNDLDARLNELGFSGGYVLGGKMEGTNPAVIGYIARFGRIEYGYIYSGEQIRKINSLPSYQTEYISDIAIFSSEENARNRTNSITDMFLGPLDTITILWTHFVSSAVVDQQNIEFIRGTNGFLQINSKEHTERSDINGYSHWSYFCWSTDGKYEPNSPKS